MELSELFRPKDFVLGFAPADKWDAIGQLVEHAVATGRLPAAAAPGVRDAVIQRERSMSTGMERGVAIPHAACEALERVQAVVGIVGAKGGLPFDSIDAQPSRIIVLLLIPRAQKLVHIRTLAEIARVLGHDAVREALLAARTGAEAWEALRQGEGAHPG
jgi:PTS system fructose-specific IIA component